MELCTTSRCISNYLPQFRPFTSYRPNLPWKSSLPLVFNSTIRNNPGSSYYNNSSLKSSISEETSSGANQYVKEEPDSAVMVDEVQPEKSGFQGYGLVKDDAPTDDSFPQYDFLDKLNKELDFEDSFSIVLLGGGGLVALWLTAAIVGAIDNIPLFPKLLEVVGLGYTIWFSTRYLLFKKNRDELAAKIEEIKQQVIGSRN